MVKDTQQSPPDVALSKHLIRSMEPYIFINGTAANRLQPYR
jgi:hypothetical protein